MKHKYFKYAWCGIGLLMILSVQTTQAQEKPDLKKVLEVAGKQYAEYLKSHMDNTLYPRSINKDGTIRLVKSKDWTSGFFGGNLWYMYLLSGEQRWKDPALSYTLSLADQQYNRSTHDLGFVLYNTFHRAYNETKNDAYREVLLQAAKSLASRFDARVGAIRSWDFEPFHYPVIVDNLMNLELLFWAEKNGGSGFRQIALSHANTDMKYRFRTDNSTYHVLDFDPKMGSLLKKQTFQGYADQSCWARGQAWAIYAYTFLYRETREEKYRLQAQHAADYFIAQTDRDTDPVPFWDFNAPLPLPKDASAGAVAASALLELSHYSKNKGYYDQAMKILSKLSSEQYLAKPGSNQFFLLKHSTGHMPHLDEIDVPLVYADYYFLEALYRYQHYDKIEKTF